MIYLIQENGVMTLLGWNVDLLAFSDCSVLATFLKIILQTKEEELMLKHCSHWYECLLAGPCLSNIIFSCW